MWHLISYFRVLSRIPPKTPEPAIPTVAEETPPVGDLDSETSSAASVEFFILARRSSVPLNPDSDSFEEESVAPKVDTKLLKKCSVSSTRLDVPLLLPTGLERLHVFSVCPLYASALDFYWEISDSQEKGARCYPWIIPEPITLNFRPVEGDTPGCRKK